MARQRAVLFTGILIFLAIIPFLTASQEKDNRKTVEGKVFADVIETDSVIIIDVRSETEYRKGHIPGAINLNISNGTFGEHKTIG